VELLLFSFGTIGVSNMGELSVSFCFFLVVLEFELRASYFILPLEPWFHSGYLFLESLFASSFSNGSDRVLTTD
jgi:hypothetical protein